MGTSFPSSFRRRLYYNDPLMGVVNPNLDPEVGHSETIGIEHDFNDKTGLSVTFFNTKLRDVIDRYSPTGLESGSIPTNISTEKQRGVEIKHRQWRANLMAIMANRIDDVTYGTSKFATFDFNLGYTMNENATIYFKARNFTNQYRAYMNKGKFFQVGINCKF